MSEQENRVTDVSVVVAFVPGITGSELYSAEFGRKYPQEKRPGTTGQIWPHLARLEDIEEWPEIYACVSALEGGLGEVTPGAIVRTVPRDPPDKVYQDLITFFTAAPPSGRGFQSCTYAQDRIPGNGNLFFMIPYDWRLDNSRSSSYLGKALDALDLAYGGATGHPGKYSLFLVAHSMGGLICRHLLESSPSVKTRNWFSNLQNLITLATPHLGTPQALGAITDQIRDASWLFSSYIAHFADNKEFPSIYQLLPPPQIPFVNDSDNNKRYSIYNGPVHDLLLATYPLLGFGANAENFVAAENFFRCLSYDTRSEGVATPVPYNCFAGTQLKTADAFLYNSGWAPVPRPSDRLYPKYEDTAGDGTVPESSAVYLPLQGVSVRRFPHKNHLEMSYDPDVMNAIADILDRPRAQRARVVSA